MWRLTIAFALVLAGSAVNAQDANVEQANPPTASPNGTRPFLFDARMPGDGVRQRAPTGNHHPNAGAIVVPPKTNQPGPER